MGFFRNFEKRLYIFLAAEQKVVPKKIIERIVIDRDNIITKTFIWWLPKGEMTQIDQPIERKKHVFLSTMSLTWFGYYCISEIDPFTTIADFPPN